VNDTESLISQYADDAFLVLNGCETSLRETLICFENFEMSHFASHGKFSENLSNLSIIIFMVALFCDSKIHKSM
jgi:hypothetical protein